LGVKRQGREADHSLPSNAAVKECVELYLHSSNTVSWRGAQLKKSTGTTLPLPSPLFHIHIITTWAVYMNGHYFEPNTL
jgi:hypothetical protein